MKQRLQKAIAQAGITSRRKAEKLILENRVKVNGIIVNQLGSSVDSKDIITIDDKPIEKERYRLDSKLQIGIVKSSSTLKSFTCFGVLRRNRKIKAIGKRVNTLVEIFSLLII